MQCNHVHQQTAQRVAGGPTREVPGNRIHEHDLALGIGGDHAFADAAQRGGKPGFAGAQAAFHLMFVDGNLHRAAQFGIADGFEDVTERLRVGRPVDGFLIGMRGDVNDRGFELGLHGLRGGDAVHIALDADIHQDQIERRGPGKMERFFAGTRDGRHLIAQPLEPALDIGGDNAFIFNDQDLFVSFG